MKIVKLVIYLYQQEGWLMKNNFDEVIRFKPEASRKSSKECYLLGKFKK